MSKWFLKLRTAAFFVVFALTLTACGDDEPEKGTPLVCTTVDDCGAGFECTDGACEALYPCSGASACERGSCVDGACVNADSCDTDDACIAGYGCSAGTCINDPCSGVTCDAGVCSPDTGQCINSDICTAATAAVDCLEGFYCFDQQCTSGSDVCAQVDCQFGQCDPASESCVNAETCSADAECLEGFFCDDGTCSQNVCDASMIMCGRGVCDGPTGDCVNADPCTAGTDCVNGFYCISGACTTVGDACDACDGNKVCNYDGTDAVTCDENTAGCFNASDCNDARVCRSGACTEAPACTPDTFEPNEVEADAVDFVSAAPQGNYLDATLCTGDVDQFFFDTTATPTFTGILSVAVSFNSEDVGNGELEFEVFGPDGSSVATTTTTNGNGLITYDVGALTRGVYRVVVSGGANLSTAGVRYGLYINFDEGAAVNACSSAPETLGMVSENTSNGLSALLGSSCVTDGPTTSESIYKVTVARRQLLTAVIQNTTPGTDLSVGIRSQCLVDASEITCSVGPADIAERAEAFVNPGVYYVVVQGTQGGISGGFDLDIQLNDVVCAPGQKRCINGSTTEVCRDNGTGFDQIACENGCDAETGFCDITEGDVCLAPIDASAGGVFMGNLDDFTADFDPLCAPYGAEGRDVVYEIQTSPGDTVSVEFDASFDAVLYAIRSCDDIDASCVDGVDDTISTPEVLTFTATGGTYFIVGDGYGVSDSGTYTMTIDVSGQVCTSGQQQCNGADLETCNSLGTGYDVRTCAGGCDAATSTCSVPANTLCGGAVDVSAGGQFTGFIDDYTADYDSTDDACGFSASPARDATYVVNATAGDVIDVDVTAPFSVVVYATTDCTTLGTTCVGGSSSFAADFRTVADTTGPIYIIVDSDDTNPSGQFTLDVVVQSQVCQPGNPTCAADGITLEYCDQFGLGNASYTCSTTCQAGATTCSDPSGDICFDATVAQDGDQLSGDYGGTADFNPGEGTAGNCTFPSGDAPVGVDYFYDVTIPAGESLLASFTSGSSFAVLYLLGDCADANSCLAQSVSGDEGELFWANDTGVAQDLTLVVDRTLTGTSSLTYDVAVDIFVPDCSTPNSDITCLDGTTLLTCDAYGRHVNETCNFGCNAGLSACNDPTNDTCAAPGIDASAGGTFSATIEDYVDDFDPTSSGCTGVATPGPDGAYIVAGTPGDIVSATLTSDFDSALYTVTDCSNVTSSCTVGVDDSFSAPEELSALIPPSGVLYVIVDALSATATGDFTIDISVDPPICTPNDVFCQNGDLATCDALGGDLSLRPCVAGCDSTTNTCNPVPNDTCGGTGIDATAGGTFVGLIDDFANDYDPGGSGCTGFIAAGGDAVYTVNLAQGEILRAEMTADFDASLYVLTDCSMTSSCVAGDDSGTIEEVEFAAATAGTYYIIADAYSSAGTGIFELDVTVSQPVCTANQATCDAVTGDLVTCNAVGSDFSTKYCQNGCDGTALSCFAPTNETCAAATPADAGGIFRGSIGDYTSDYDAAGAACVGRSTPGGDAVYSISANSGDTIAAFLDADFNASMYLVSDCANIGTSCEAGAVRADAQLGFDVVTSGVYYLVVDSPSGATGNFELEVVVGVPFCTAGQAQCAPDGTTLEYCSGYENGYRNYACNGTCTVDACDNPTGEVCADALVLQSGATVNQAYSGANSFVIPVGTSGACTIPSGDDAVGVDYFYAVDLLAGQTLTATYTSSSSFAVMYLMGSCLNVNSCLDTTASGSGGTITYTATTAERVNIVMDRTLSGTSTLDFDLDVTIN